MTTVTIERAGQGQAIAIVGGRRFPATFEPQARRWRVETADGAQMSAGAKLHSIGKLFGADRAQVVEPAAVYVLDDAAVAAQVRRMLASMREFGFELYWQDHGNEFGGDTGHTVRVPGDPIFHTIGQVAGVTATRAQTIEGIAALAEGRRPELPPRMQTIPAAVKTIAEHLATGRRLVHLENGTTVRIVGPTLPTEGVM